MLDSFDHAVIAVRDLAVATERTAALIGRPASWCGVHPGAGTANSLFRLENTALELLARDGAGPVGDLVDAALARSGEGLLALAFATADIGAAAAQLRRSGVEVGDPRAGEGRRSADDPGGPDGAGVRRWSSLLLPAAATRGLSLLVLQRDSPSEALPLTAPVGAPEAALAALDHVVVASGDPAASGKFYGETLGLRLALDRDFVERGLRILFFRVGGVTVEVAGPRSPSAGETKADRFGGLAYRVPDVHGARERLLAADFDVSSVRAGHKPGTQVCTVRSGTCGVPTLLIEPAPRP